MQNHQFAEFNGYIHKLHLYPRKVFPDRTIHSIYLDTPVLDDYQDNVAGISRRSKARIRWYNGKPHTPALEFKLKRNKASEKKVIALDNPKAVIPNCSSALKLLMAVNSGSPYLKYIYGLYPVLEVEYRRKYFMLNSQTRMTIDQRLRYRQLFPIRRKHFVCSPVDVVIELKYPLGIEREVKSMLAGIPFRAFRHSKYVIGVDSACGSYSGC